MSIEHRKVELQSLEPDQIYSADHGRVFLSGTQALVRLPIVQRRIDAFRRLNTAGYISGYRGSPLGRYDAELWRAKNLLREHHIVFNPGLNEDLAAAAIWGSQQVGLFPNAKYEGVFSLWYGKGPGVDRSGDAFKHANLFGTAAHGGALVAFGDDHAAKSSTIAHQSEQALIASMIPVLNPSSVAELIEYGLFGWALSRFAGVWVGMKCVTDIVESSATIDTALPLSEFMKPANISLPEDGVHGRFGHEPIQAEYRMMRHKLPLAMAFAHANTFDRVVLEGKKKRLGIVTTGKAYNDVRSALRRLGLDDTTAIELGIGIYKVGMAWPLEPEGLKRFASGYEELIFVEEKRPIIEEQAARALVNFSSASRPRIVGKTDENDRPLIPSDGELDAAFVARTLMSRLKTLTTDALPLRDEPRQYESNQPQSYSDSIDVSRRPYFCSGCPHNRSTKAPEGSYAMAGIGCSYMAVWMDRRTVTSVHMGAEGANWTGIAPFTNVPHVFQNMGDGTYFHSGLLAIRAAVAARVNITYKILYNDAVAMTGGQPVDGPLSVAKISWQVYAEGIRTIVIVADEPAKYKRQIDLAPGVEVAPRDELELVQERLSGIGGVSILIYDQTCAAEKRRRRKLKAYPDPPKRVFINASVCENCGDCSTASNCVSIYPRDTLFGRKRAIDQASCNKDFSCIDGFCPSFVTIHGGRLRKPKPDSALSRLITALPEPKCVDSDPPHSTLIAGIGGTGVVTVGSILSLAAHLEGKDVRTFDMTGLAQKNGAVVSHVQISSRHGQIYSTRIEKGHTSLLLACDLIASCNPEILSLMSTEYSTALINNRVLPTGDFQLNRDVVFEPDRFIAMLKTRSCISEQNIFDAVHACQDATGSGEKVNLLMLGYASQMGLLPVSRTSIERAIEHSESSSKENNFVFGVGRYIAHRRLNGDAHGTNLALLKGDEPSSDAFVEVEKLAKFLTEYQNIGYADRFREFVEKVAHAERSMVAGSLRLTLATARSLAKLMAYKDEYEVARLYTNRSFMKEIHTQFEGDYKLHFHFAPPTLSRRSVARTRPAKMEIGFWFLPILHILSWLRKLRGTPFDLFGYSRERSSERRLITDFMNTLASMLGYLCADNFETAVKIATVPQDIRGFGFIKEESIEKARHKEAELLSKYWQEAKAQGSRQQPRCQSDHFF